MKKITLALVLLTGLALVGCQSGSDTSTNVSSSKESIEVVTTTDAPVAQDLGPVVQKLVYYHGAECPHCHALKKFLPDVQKLYPSLEIEEYEVWHDPQNAARAQAHVAELGGEFSAVPTIVIKDEFMTGFSSERLLEFLERKFGAPKK